MSLPSSLEAGMAILAKHSAAPITNEAAPAATAPAPDAALQVTAAAIAATAAPESAEPEAAVETEAAPAEVTPASTPAAPEDRFSSRFAALSRKERTLRQRETELETRMKTLEAQAGSSKAVSDRLAAIKSDPLAALKEAGISFNDLANEVLLGQSKPVAEVDPMDAKIREIVESQTKSSREELDALKSQIMQEKVEAGESALRRNLVGTIEAQKEQFELCASMGDEAIDLAREVIDQYWAANKQVLTYAEVLGMVESHYEDQILKRLLVTTKAQKLAAPKAAPIETPKPAPAKTAPRPVSTLSNAAKAKSDTQVNVDRLPMNDAIQHLLKKHGF